MTARLRLTVPALLLLAAPGHPAAAQQPPLIPIETLFASATVWDVKISPDGKWIAYTHPEHGQTNIFVRPLAGGAERAITRDTLRSVDSYRWSADGRRILFLQDNGGDEGYHLFAVNAAPGSPAPRDLTPFQGIETELFAVPARTPHTVLITLNRRNPQLADAYRLDLATGALEMAAENPGTFLGYAADASNRVRVAYSVDTLGMYHLLARPSERDPWADVTVYPVEDKITPLRFHADGKRIYMLSNHGSDLMQLVLKDVATGAETVVDRDPLGEVDIDAALFDETTGELLVTRYIGDTIRWYPKTAAMRRFASSANALGRSLSEIGAATRAGTQWTFRVESPVDPGAVYFYNAKSGRSQLLFELFPALRASAMALTQPVRFTSRDGLTLHGYLTLPRGRAPRKLPLVLYVHGGPWSRDIPTFEGENQLFANRGYAVLAVNYRGSTGYGKKFSRAAKHEFGRAMQNDLLDGVQWAVDRGTVDPARIAIVGGSYGGYAALVGLTFNAGTFACVADYAGPSNLVTLMEAFPPSWAPFLPRNWYPLAGNPNHADDRAMLLERSPIFRVDSARAPLLIFQGVNDPRVTQAQSDQIAIALHARKIPVTYLLASNTGHNFGGRATSLAVNRAAELFFATCLGGRAQESVDPSIDATLNALTVNLDSLARAALRPSP
jgi:dipeptidyl aminopeptidase/acylaminoacyl peptidase